LVSIALLQVETTTFLGLSGLCDIARTRH